MEMMNAIEMSDYSALLYTSLTQDRINEIVSRANRSGLIDSLMDMLGIRPASEKDEVVIDCTRGKILILGRWAYDESILRDIGRQTKIDPNRFEIFTDYGRFKSRSFERIRYSDKYACVLFGAIPHKAKDLNGSSNLISRMENEPGFPHIERIGCNENKLTKSGIIKALRKLKKAGIIQQAGG